MHTNDLGVLIVDLLNDHTGNSVDRFDWADANLPLIADDLEIFNVDASDGFSNIIVNMSGVGAEEGARFAVRIVRIG